MTDERYQAIIQKGQRAGWVYFVQSSRSSAIKIGWAKDPAVRLEALQIGHPKALDLIAAIPGTRHLEADIHRRLWKARLRGEWFERNQTLKLVRPVILEHGLFLTARATMSRTIPGTAKWVLGGKREFHVSNERLT